MNEVLEQVKEYADRAHGEQRRKYTPDRYIVHPIRVMKLCAEYTNNLPMLAAALLHDVLEDTPVKKEQLHQFLLTLMREPDATQATHLVVELSDVFVKDAYPHWNRRKRKQKERERIGQTSPESQTIKYADILDNCSEIVEHDPEFAPTFLRECKQLLEVIPKGNPELYQRSKEAVMQALDKLGPRRGISRRQ
jgi:guanosine-3',5'-bis(diphosphate) 3'-pyrophosphohydrolase